MTKPPESLPPCPNRYGLFCQAYLDSIDPHDPTQATQALCRHVRIHGAIVPDWCYLSTNPKKLEKKPNI